MGDSAVLVGGRFERSIAEHIHMCLVSIEQEQSKANPDNHVIAVLCDSVRMGREYADHLRRSVR